MKLHIGGRGCGKTSDIIREAAARDARGEVVYIVVPTAHDAMRVAEQAREMGCAIRFPATFDEWRRGDWGRAITGLLFDDVDRMLAYGSRHASVLGMSATAEVATTKRETGPYVFIAADSTRHAIPCEAPGACTGCAEPDGPPSPALAGQGDVT